MRKFYKVGAGVVAGVGASVSSSFAALEVADLTAIQAGITGADANFYAIGGTILTVLAGIWGFKLVKSLMR